MTSARPASHHRQTGSLLEDTGLISAPIDHADGMTHTTPPSPDLAAAGRAYADFLKLRRDAPPRFVGLYLPNTEDGWSFVALFDTEKRPESLRLLAAAVRACRPESPLLVPVDDPDCFQLLDAGTPGLPLAEFRRLLRAFERGERAILAGRRYRRFSPGYYALLRRMRGS